MISIHKALRAHLLHDTLLSAPIPKQRDIKALRVSEWSTDFEKLMRNRLVQGAFRYHTFAERRKGVRYNMIQSAIERLQLYLVDGNLEHLVDAANFCMMEFDFPVCHPSPHFKPIDDGMHAQRLDEPPKPLDSVEEVEIA